MNTSSVIKNVYQAKNYWYKMETVKQIIGDCKSIYSVNPLYLRITHVNGYIEE